MSFFPLLHLLNVNGKRLPVNHCSNSNMGHCFKQNIFFCQVLLLYLPRYCVQNSSSVRQQTVVFVNIHTYFTALQLGPEFEQESTISPFSESPLAVYCVGRRLDTGFKNEFEDWQKVMLAHSAREMKTLA